MIDKIYIMEYFLPDNYSSWSKIYYRISSDNSQYWLGEAYYVLQDYGEAIQQYKRLIEQFPNSKKSSHAMLKIGYCHEKLGSVTKAVETLSELQELFPNSAAARLGRAKIEKLRSN